MNIHFKTGSNYYQMLSLLGSVNFYPWNFSKSFRFEFHLICFTFNQMGQTALKSAICGNFFLMKASMYVNYTLKALVISVLLWNRFEVSILLWEELKEGNNSLLCLEPHNRGNLRSCFIRTSNLYSHKSLFHPLPTL